MERYKKLQEDRYYRYSSNDFIYVTNKISKSKFIKTVCKVKREESPNWIRERVSEGANEKTLKTINNNPDALVLILNKITSELIQIIK